MRGFLFVVALLHAGFAVCELFPWRLPLLLRIAGKTLPEIEPASKWTASQQAVVATIVHNAAIYNAIVAGGLFWAAAAAGGSPDTARAVARVLLAGAAAAGLFGTATLKSRITAIQAALGIIGLVLF